ncbi:MAG TPA: dTMP kinase [Armatimonadota bacterium]
MRGIFLTFEGPEGAGKSSQAQRLRSRLEELGLGVVMTREPGGVPVAEDLRRIVLQGDPLPRTEALVFLAARAEHAERALRPALEDGAVVICDRFSDSTLAYQGYGLGMDLDELRALNRFAAGGLTPDLTLLLDLPPETGLSRRLGVPLEGRRGGQLGLGLEEDDRAREERLLATTRIEARDLGFHRRVREGFLAEAAREPDRFVVIDGALPKEDVAERLWTAVSGWLAARRPELLPAGRSDAR